MSRATPYLLATAADAPFPPAEHALSAPNGLLAIGGDLSAERLLSAYANGIFPWFSEGQPILWWSPDPRALFRTETVRLTTRFRRQLRKSAWVVRADTAFAEVINHCAQIPRHGQDGTWITATMRAAYLQLHRLGYAHSIEVFEQTRLVGGIYGVAIGKMFFGESMFSRESGGSKIALAALADYLHMRGWPLIDAQMENPHLLRLGAQVWSRQRFLAALRAQIAVPSSPGAWSADHGERHASTLAALPG